MTQARELLKCERCAVFLLALEEGGEEVKNFTFLTYCAFLCVARIDKNFFSASESLRSYPRKAWKVNGGKKTSVQKRSKPSSRPEKIYIYVISFASSNLTSISEQQHRH